MLAVMDGRDQARHAAGDTPLLLRDERYLDVHGLRLRVSVEGDGEPLLLINGLGANIELWQPLRAQLSHRTTIAFDAPGVGRSAMSPRPLRIADLAEVVAEMLTQLDYDVVDVLGYSLGGAIAQELARRHPRRVRRLVLTATIPGVGSLQNPLALLELVSVAVRRDGPARNAAAGRVVGGETVRDPRMQAWVQAAHRSQPVSKAGLVRQVVTMAGWSSLPWLHTLTAATLVLTGDRDPLVPAVNSRIFSARIPDCRRYVVRGGGHLFPIDQAHDAAPAIAAFLNGEQ
jgi:poly(3-hydroxyoctanoate) depolymerase